MCQEARLSAGSPVQDVMAPLAWGTGLQVARGATLDHAHHGHVPFVRAPMAIPGDLRADPVRALSDDRLRRRCEARKRRRPGEAASPPPAARSGPGTDPAPERSGSRSVNAHQSGPPAPGRPGDLRRALGESVLGPAGQRPTGGARVVPCGDLGAQRPNGCRPATLWPHGAGTRASGQRHRP